MKSFIFNIVALIGFFISLIIQLTIKEPVRGALQNKDQKNPSSSFENNNKKEELENSSSKEENENGRTTKEQENRIMSSCGSSFVFIISCFFTINTFFLSLCV